MMIMIMFWKEGWGTLDTYLETILIDPMMMWYQKSTISRKVISFHSNICSISSSSKYKEKGEWMGIVNFNTSLTRIFETPKTGIMLRKLDLLSTFKNDNQGFNQQHSKDKRLKIWIDQRTFLTWRNGTFLEKRKMSLNEIEVNFDEKRIKQRQLVSFYFKDFTLLISFKSSNNFKRFDKDKQLRNFHQTSSNEG